MSHSRFSTIAFGGYTVLLLAFVFTPIGLVVLFSFDSKGTTAFPFIGPTLQWYTAVASDPIIRGAALNSIIVAFGTTVCCILIGTSAAFVIARFRSRAATGLAALLSLPLLLPHLLLGISLLSFFTSLGIGLRSGPRSSVTC